MRNTNRKICKIFSNNLRYYMKLYEKSRQDLVKDLGFNYSTVCNWLSSYSYASEDRIEQLADYFGISKYQLTENENEQPTIYSSSKKRKELIEISAQLTDEELETLLLMANQLIKNK